VAAVDNYNNSFFKTNHMELELARLMFAFLREKGTSIVANLLSFHALGIIL